LTTEHELLIEDVGPIRHLILNRPDRLNAVNLQQHERLISVLQAAEADSEIRVITFSGMGRAFCSGDDMKEFGVWPERMRNRLVDLDMGMGPLLLQEVVEVIWKMAKPTVALLHGPALGAGYDYALTCDFRFVTEDCSLGDPRIHNAMWCAEGWSYKLPRLIAGGHASRIALLGRPLSGSEAYEVGLAHRLYPAGSNVRSMAHEELSNLAAMDPTTYTRAKRSLQHDLDRSWQTLFAD